MSGLFYVSHKSMFATGQLASWVYQLSAVPFVIWRRLFARNATSFIAAREELRGALDFLASDPSDSELPWLVGRTSHRSAPFKAHLRYAKRRAFAVRSPAAAFNDPDADIFRWGILALHADVPFPALFDLGKFQHHGNNLAGTKFVSEIVPRLAPLLRDITALQTRWLGSQFLLPLKHNATLCHAFFGYTSELTRILLLLAQLIYAIETGLCFEQKNGARLLRRITKVSAELLESKASLADLLFLHNATLKIWLSINGERSQHPAALIDSLQPGVVGSLDKHARIAGALDKLLTGNPVSLIMSMGLLVDAGLAERDEERLPSIAHLFKQKIPGELLIELAKHLYSSLMSDLLKPGETVFGTTVANDATYLFDQRLSFVASVLCKSLDELGSDDDAERAYLRFAGYFFEFLLREWLQERSVDVFKQDILRQADVGQIPELVTLSIIKVCQADGALDREVVMRELSGGKDFAEVARKYSEDKLSRSAGGSLGTVKLGDLPDEIEATVFLAVPEVSLLRVDGGDYSFFIRIQERKYSGTTSFVKQLACLLQGDHQALQTGCEALIDVLNRMTKMPAFHRQQDDTSKRVLRLTERMGAYAGLLGYSSQGVTVL
ncbi:hypothetical protein MNBD_CHLOROFLEXI01-505 [hydrothermal vent metagenome]|uniref:Uncharacterized protein n=1 Tax=hydrothermal vent metagenome TaxID=652676 RepID=A0A3B0VFE8_9ZZZZ